MIGARRLALGAAVLVATSCGEPAVEDLLIEDAPTFHQRAGFVQMVPPVHLPSSSEEIDQVQSWLRVPPGQTIGAVRDTDGLIRLEFPPGTWADRVEYAGKGEARFVADIRGSEIMADGSQRFHTLRPLAPHPQAALVGVRWPRGNQAAHDRATERLLDRLRETVPARNMAEPDREALLERVRGMNDCLPCHTPNRPDNRTAHQYGLVARGTDVSGLFTPSTVLRDRIPLEQYGAFDNSHRDPSISIECSGEVVRPEQLVDRRCADGTMAQGRWSVAKARRSDPERAKAVCASRRFLVERLDPDARELVGDILVGCP